MINPVITKKTGKYETEEGCLSLDGVRPCTRYKEIEVDYLDAEEDKTEKILENQQIIKTPVVRNGKQSTIGYQPDVWKKWE
jgi:peptide deformylase